MVMSLAKVAGTAPQMQGACLCFPEQEGNLCTGPHYLSLSLFRITSGILLLS